MEERSRPADGSFSPLEPQPAGRSGGPAWTSTLPLRMAAALLAWRGLIVPATIGGGALALLLSFVLPPRYIGRVTFIAEHPQAIRLPSGLAGMAAQFGLPAFGGSGARSPDFYADLLESERVLRSILDVRFPVDSIGADSVRLIEFLEIDAETEAARRATAVRGLRERVQPSVDLRTGVTALEVDMPSAVLAAAVANRLVHEANAFNYEVRQTQDGERRRFIEERLSVAQRDLTQAVGALRAFLEQNRRYEGSPTKQFEEAQLSRQVDVAQEVYLTLRRELEMARIEVQNDIPVLTVIDPALPPLRPSFPRPFRMLVLGVLVGFIGASTWALLVEYIRLVSARDPTGQSAVISELRQARVDVRRLSRLRGRIGAGR